MYINREHYDGLSSIRRHFPVKAKHLLTTLLRLGRTTEHQAGSRRTLSPPDFPDIVFAFHDVEETPKA
jgi:predicted RNA binding protein YcfA (HicA-like mRNA interferase family)